MPVAQPRAAQPERAAQSEGLLRHSPTLSLRTAVITLATVSFIMLIAILLSLAERGGAAFALNAANEGIRQTRFTNEALSEEILEARAHKRITVYAATHLKLIVPGDEDILYVEVPPID